MAVKIAVPTSILLRLARKQISTQVALRRLYSSRAPTVAVLFQDIDPPVINGVRKPRKPGGRYLYSISLLTAEL
jgi:hypothetical protein